MKKYIFLTLILLVIFSLFLVKYIQKSPIEFNTLKDDIWRSKIVYKKMDELPLEKRHEIYRQFIYEMFIGSIPDSAYREIAKRSNLSLEEVKNIIGEGIALNWKIKNIDSSANRQK